MTLKAELTLTGVGYLTPKKTLEATLTEMALVLLPNESKLAFFVKHYIQIQVQRLLKEQERRASFVIFGIA